jgi:hypothetical protein
MFDVCELIRWHTSRALMLSAIPWYAVGSADAEGPEVSLRPFANDALVSPS